MVKERVRNRHWEGTSFSGMDTRRGDPKDRDGASYRNSTGQRERGRGHRG